MLIFAFGLCLVEFFLQCGIFTNFVLFSFAPFITLVILTCPFHKTLWLAFITGGMLDLLSSDPMGIHALQYVGASLIFFRYRRYFLYDNYLHFSIANVLVSFTLTLFNLFFLFLFDRRVPFHGKWILGDLFGMPIVDGIYAFLWFSGPFYIYILFKKYGRFYWHKMKRKLFPSIP